AAAPIDLAIVEPDVGKVSLRVHDDLEAVSSRINKRDSVLRAGNEAAALFWRNRPDPHGRRPLRQMAMLVQAKDLSALDVEPVQRPFPRDPHRPFAEQGMDVRNALDPSHGHRPRQKCHWSEVAFARLWPPWARPCAG